MAFKTSFLPYAAYIGAWLLAAALAVVLALASPNEWLVVVQLPAVGQGEGAVVAVNAQRSPQTPPSTSRQSA